MNGRSKLDDMLKSNSRQALLTKERARQVEQRIADEAKRQAHTAAKTAELRELRLAKVAAEREGAPS